MVVWGTWAGLTLAGLAFVAVYGRNCPYMDEWAFLAAYAGDADLLTWLWEPHFEHRYPLGRLIHLGLFRLASDLRAGMALSVLCLSGAAALLTVAAGRVRGRRSLSDLFFPLALLHPGHRENVLMSYQVCFTVPLLITAGLAYLTIRPAESWTRRRATVAGLLTPLLPGFGNAGLALTAAGVGLVAVNYPNVEPAGISRSVARAWGFATRIAAMGFGLAAEWLWLPAAATIGTGLGRGLIGLCRARLAGDAAGAVAALVVPAGGGLLAAALVWGRGWTGVEGH